MRIRVGRRGDGEALQDIERRAGEQFRTVGLDTVADDDPPALDVLASYLDMGLASVATDDDDVPVGYILMLYVDGNVHIEQVSVVPEWQGRGVGRALIDEVRTRAEAAGRPTITLTTFTGVVPWNQPLYEHLGFVVMTEEQIGPELRAKRDRETEHGLDPALRVCMRLPL